MPFFMQRCVLSYIILCGAPQVGIIFMPTHCLAELSYQKGQAVTIYAA